MLQSRDDLMKMIKLDQKLLSPATKSTLCKCKPTKTIPSSAKFQHVRNSCAKLPLIVFCLPIPDRYAKHIQLNLIRIINYVV